MSKTLAAAAFAVTALMAVQPASAAVVVTSSVSDILPASSVLLDFTPYYSGSNPGYESPGAITIGGTTITFDAGAYLAEGTSSGVAAAPYAEGGVDTNAYLAAEPNASITLTFSGQQSNFGLLWGSVDTYNTLKFYNGSTIVETVTSADLVVTANGYQGDGGSAYVNILFTGGETFDKVVATSSSPAFEFDYVSTVPVPEPSMWFLMLSGFGAVGFAMRSRKLAVAAA